MYVNCFSIFTNINLYIGIDLFGLSDEIKHETIPSTNFSNLFKKKYFHFNKKQDPYNLQAVSKLLKRFAKIEKL